MIWIKHNIGLEGEDQGAVNGESIPAIFRGNDGKQEFEAVF